MFIFLRPSKEQLESFRQSQESLLPPLAELGLTRNFRSPESGYQADEANMLLGQGEAVFDRAVQALVDWRHFSLGWVFPFPEKPKLETGTTVVVAACHGIVWSANACRVVYTVDETDKSFRRFGYGYAALPGHSEQGEELFLIEWNRQDNSVNYRIFAYSRANHPLVALLYPFARYAQEKFRTDSMNALLAAISA